MESLERYTPNTLETTSYFAHLVCSACGTIYAKEEVQNLCRQPDCQRPLLAVYDIKGSLDRDRVVRRPPNLWRYQEMLPVIDGQHIISLGEGFTPLLKANRLSQAVGLCSLFIKDESTNPTGSFKARGMSVAVSKAKELGIATCAVPTAGNAGGAMSAYCAKAGIGAHVFMPVQTPAVFKQECRFFGATVTEVEGSIFECGQEMRKKLQAEGWFDMSTTKEPYRVEGKKTLGYEIAEQLNWQLPDVIVYPTGGGTGLIGMWKAFDEMEQLGWITSKRPRMVAVQSENCAPLYQAFQNKQRFTTYFESSFTVANGLRVPKPYADTLLLDILFQSKGTVEVVSDAQMVEGIQQIARSEGLFVAPEGGAIWVALTQLVAKHWVHPEETVVLVNTGSAYKYLDNL